MIGLLDLQHCEADLGGEGVIPWGTADCGHWWCQAPQGPPGFRSASCLTTLGLWGFLVDTSIYLDVCINQLPDVFFYLWESDPATASPGWSWFHNHWKAAGTRWPNLQLVLSPAAIWGFPQMGGTLIAGCPQKAISFDHWDAFLAMPQALGPDFWRLKWWCIGQQSDACYRYTMVYAYALRL